MCGILGAIPAIDRGAFEAALNLLAHRGPDDGKTWTEPTQKVMLGHRRLAIIDLSDRAAQPMIRDNLVLCYNGEVYNFKEIRAELIKLGHQFQSETDSEVVLAAYQQWGSNCLERFNGMFAFAIWDQAKQELFLARDRFGQKPLFYFQEGNQFYFASEMKALLPFIPSPRPAKDFSTLAENFLEYEATEACLVECIKRFPAGHFGYLRNGIIRMEKWWDLLDNLGEVPLDFQGQVERFKELFFDACRIRLVSDVKVGTSLSGGLDSSAVIANIFKHVQQTHGGHVSQFNNPYQSAFIAGFPGSDFDESHQARQLVEALDLEANYVQIKPDEALEQLMASQYFFEEIHDTSPVPMTRLYQAQREKGVTVSLDGHGADELLSGYAEGLFHAFPDCGINPGKVGSVLNAFNDLHPSGRQFAKPKAGWGTWLRYLLSHPFGVYKAPSKLKGHFNKYLYEVHTRSILPTMLRNYDRYSMMYGVEVRMPFLDHRLVSYCFSLGMNAKIRNGFTKAILRESLVGLIPEETRLRKTKIGFTTPIIEWINGPWLSWFEDTLNSQAFRQCELVDHIGIKKHLDLVNSVGEPHFSYGLKLWRMIAPFLWEQAFLKGKGKPV